MSTRIREIYYYAVCFVTLIITIFALTGVVDTIAEMAYPYPQYTPSKLEMIQMNEQQNTDVSDPEKMQKLLEAEQKAQAERDKAARQHQVARQLSRNLSLLIVAVPLYLYHWRRVRKFES